MRQLCIHGHFYQPARENPWTGVVELQDAAAPYHDWNARITAECYARNAASRILDPDDRVVRIVNNYARISFDVGPTLFRWLATAAPATYELILEADATSRREQYSHGGALAQVYSHLIMPLATPPDRVTQVRWGMRDFERRFRRRPEGMWLAETAVDLATLEILTDHGITFTILAPRQAARVRRADGTWTQVTEDTLDVSVPYRCRLPSGRTIALFFYQGPLSRAIAFEGVLHDGAGFADRLAGALPASGPQPGMLLVATDGETYGHHHAFGDMALAAALERLSHDENLRLTNCAAFLAAHPPAAEVEITENTSWSCVHGIERWRSDCGCHTKDGTQQRWRAPLREAVTWLAFELGARFERAGSEMFRDPWAARDEAIDLVDSSEGTAEGFFRRHGVGDHAVGTARVLLEMQRQAMLMQSSDGWFFDDVAGTETVQILSHAARAIELAGEAAAELEEGLLAYLRRAPGNTDRFPHGAAVYE
jgi:alpha-amylase/alpha-mannosidase (GH57 family)